MGGSPRVGGWGSLPSAKREYVGVWGRSPQINDPGPLVASWSSYALHVWLLQPYSVGIIAN